MYHLDYYDNTEKSTIHKHVQSEPVGWF